MQVWETDLTFFPKLGDNLTLCLGYFDGVHLGHQSLIQKGLTLSSNVGVLTFDRHPKPGSDVTSITPLNVKKQFLKTFGIQHLIIIQFTDVVKMTSKETFIHFLKQIGTNHVVCGPDFTFGYKAQGTIADLKAAGFTLTVIDPLTHQHQKISSSSIRLALSEGRVSDVLPLLGRYYEVSGIVGRGLGKGKTLGYPTANMMLDEPYILPKNGVYIMTMTLDNQTHYAIASLGYHPTVANLKKPSLEVHVLDYDHDLYDKHLKVQFLEYLREEKKFNSLEELITQMDKDKTYAIARRNVYKHLF
jgi:riboflavin kinase/FMN adenylyltransferase